MSAYLPFSGDDTVCRKCHHPGARTAYRDVRCHQLPNGAHFAPSPLGGYTPDEHLCRMCTRCDYTWDEALANG